MKEKKYAWINLIALLLTVGVNTLGGFGLINGTDQSEVSDRYQTLITPSGMTFSIWSVIYVLLFVSILMMILRRGVPYYERAIRQISVLFWLTCAFNIAWIVTFSFVLVELSVLFIFALLITLTIICRKLYLIQEDNRFLLPLTFGLYAGWLMIATVVNISAALVKQEWDGFGVADNVWAMIILAVAVVLVLLVTMNTHNAVLPLPVAWAYFGIFSALGSEEGLPGDHTMLRGFAIGGMIALVLIAVWQFYRNRYRVTAFPEAKQVH